ncbi:MAG TPA: hypothetical protein VJ998_12790 [Pseudomonadales bacterium]|nr:hypothetical protein [Pseudomonadales bacterium]
MDEEDYDEALIEESDDIEDSGDYDSQIGRQRHDVRRKIEELLERKRLREEFGDLDDF